MKKYLIQILCCLCILSWSCKKDSARSSTFIIETEDFSQENNIFLIVSNQKDETLFRSYNLQPNIAIKFKYNELDQIDVTYGYYHHHNPGFSITTFRDIQPGFKLTRKLFCKDGFYEHHSSTVKPIEIEIIGLTDFLELYNSLPRNRQSTVEINELTNSLTIKSKVRTSSDYVITVLENEQSIYKSILLDKQNWNTIADSIKMSVNFEDFSEFQKHEIELNDDKNWSLNSEILTSDKELIKLTNWINSSVIQSGNTLKYFIPQNMEVDSIDLYIQAASASSFYLYNFLGKDIPNQINISNQFIDIVSYTPWNYSLQTSADIDLNILRYRYHVPQDSTGLYGFGLWTIYEKGDTEIENTLPSLDLEAYFGGDKILEVIESPSQIDLQSYDFFDNEIELNSTEAVDEIRCLNSLKIETRRTF